MENEPIEITNEQKKKIGQLTAKINILTTELVFYLLQEDLYEDATFLIDVNTYRFTPQIFKDANKFANKNKNCVATNTGIVHKSKIYKENQ